MKRSLVLSVALFVAAAAAVQAAPGRLTALGLYGSINGSQAGSTGSGVGLSLGFGGFPVIGLEYDFTEPRFGLSVDAWVVNDRFSGTPLSYYIGVGGFGGIAFNRSNGFDLGVRLPLGLQIFPLRQFEIYLEVTPMLHLIALRPDLAASVGLRVHF
jgi:opacity protein-like surface antigen